MWRKKNNHIKELELKIDAFSERFDNYFNNEKSNLKIINELQSLINSETKQSDIANKSIDELYHFNEKNKQLILSLQEKLDFNALAMNDISEHEKLIKVWLMKFQS